MGTLERIRKTSPVILALFALIFVGFMVASDADISNLLRNKNNYQTAVLAKINDKEIFYKDYEAMVQLALEENKDLAKEDDFNSKVRDSIWGQLVDEIVLSQEAEKAGIWVTDNEIMEELVTNPPESLRYYFVDSAQNFNREAYTQLVTNPELIMQSLPPNWPETEKKKFAEDFYQKIANEKNKIKYSRFTRSMALLVATSGSIVSPSYTQEKYLEEKGDAQANFLVFDVAQIKDDQVSVSDEEISKYYDANKKYYEQKKAKRRLKFVSFPLVPSSKDSLSTLRKFDSLLTDLEKSVTNKEKCEVFDKKLVKYKGDSYNYTSVVEIDPRKVEVLKSLSDSGVSEPIHLSDTVYFIRRDSKKSEKELIKCSHILIRFGTQKDSALAFTQELLTKIMTGASFDSLAKIYSKDVVSGRAGGDLGWISKEMGLDTTFQEAAFATPVGGIKGPVETQFGYHIIKVVDKQSDEYKFSEIYFKTSLSTSTRKDLERQAKEIKQIVDNGKTFEEAVQEFGLKPSETPYFDKNKAVLGSQYLSAIAFENEINTCLKPVELKNRAIIVAQIMDEKPAGIPPLADMKENIKGRLARIKKLDILKQKASATYDKVKSFDSLSQASGMDPDVRFGFSPNIKPLGPVAVIGNDPVFNTNVYMLPVGKISEPIRSEYNYYIIQVTNRMLPDQATMDAEIREFKTRLMRKLSTSYLDKWFGSVKDDAKIDDFRTQFYKDY